MNVPTLREIDYALRSLKDTLDLVQHRQEMADGYIKERVAESNYAEAAVLQGSKSGLMAAETLLRIEIETLEHWRLSVEQYLNAIATQ